MEYMLTRLEWLVGPDKIQTLKDTSIALFGVGGVGGGALEALVRAGVGRIVIIDGDSIAPSNLNRQMITTHDTIGARKVEVAKARALSINPDVVIETHDIMYTEEKYPGFIQSLNVDYVIDAIDMVTAKLNIIEVCQRESIPVISCMGGGNRFYPEKLMLLVKLSACSTITVSLMVVLHYEISYTIQMRIVSCSLIGKMHAVGQNSRLLDGIY